MNSQFPNSPEDKLLDELLREQSHGPDEAFLKQLEAAVDAGSVKSVKGPAPRRYGRLAIAAGIGLAAGTGFFIHLQNRGFKNEVAVLTESRSARMSPDEVSELRESIRKQEDEVERRRKEVTTIVRTKGIIPSGSESLYRNQAEALAANDGKDKPASSLPVIDAPAPLPSLKPTPTELALNAPKSSDGSLAEKEAGVGRGRGFGLGGAGGMDKSDRDFAGVDASKPSSRAGDKFLPSDGTADSISSDRYGTFIDQPWKSPGSDPLSTFSIDVDTASYSNVRRMIREGREVPKDAVRIEECINAFSYNYAQPKGEGPFAVGATLAACPWNPSHQLVRVAIKGREIEANKRPASNLVFLVDVSGSMQSPDKLPLLKQSMATMVEQLDERDRVAIVVYAGTEGVALPSTRLDAAGKATVLKSLGKLEAGGSTNGGAGIKRAYELAMKEKIEGGVNRVILCTDGDFNVASPSVTRHWILLLDVKS